MNGSSEVECFRVLHIFFVNELASLILDYLKIDIVGTELVSLGETGISKLNQQEGIMSENNLARCFLHEKGELIVECRDRLDSPWIFVWSSESKGLGNYLTKFVLSSSGKGFLLDADSGMVKWKTPNDRLPYHRDCTLEKVIRNNPLPIMNWSSNHLWQSYLRPPFYLRFTSNALQIVSVSEKNADMENLSANLEIYPQLRTEPKWPVPLWTVPLPTYTSQK